MKKNKDQMEARKILIHKCIDDPVEGSRMIKNIAKQIEKSSKVGDSVNLLSELLCLSVETIFNDYIDCKDSIKDY